MAEVVVVKSQEELDQAIQASRTDLSIKRIEIRATKTVEIMATRNPVDRGLHDIIHVGPDLVVAGGSELELDDGVEARVYAVVEPRVRSGGNLVPATQAAQGECPLRIKVELHDFARVEGCAPLTLAVVHRRGLPELDLEGLGMAQLVDALERGQAQERC